MKKRAAAALISALYIFIILFSVLFIAVEADHTCCVSDSCPVCCQINVCSGIVKNVGTALAAAVILIAATFAAVTVIGALRCANTSTLVMLKVKLSN